jgi:phage terminase large subunit GpA-like protein
VDTFPTEAGEEGSIIQLIERRADSYDDTAFFFWLSTPLLAGQSLINQLYKRGDQSKLYVPCVKCNTYQVLTWDRFNYSVNEAGIYVPGSTYYECINQKCRHRWVDSDKVKFLPRFEWRPTATPETSGARSFLLPALYAPVGMRSWDSIGEQRASIKRDGDPPDRLQNFVNTVLAEPFARSDSVPRIEILLSRERTYRIGAETPPDGAHPLLITLHADVQGDRIETEVVAWGRNAESWSIAYEKFFGDTESSHSPVYETFRDYAVGPFWGLKPLVVGIDSGYHTDAVYEFCGENAGFFPTKGTDAFARTSDRAFIRTTYLPEYQTHRIDMNVDLIKSRVYSYLKGEIREDGSKPVGYCNFPADYSIQHLSQLVAEVPVFNGKRIEWHAGQRRNEQLDVRVGNLALLHFVRECIRVEEGLDSLAWEDFWTMLEEARKAGG